MPVTQGMITQEGTCELTLVPSLLIRPHSFSRCSYEVISLCNFLESDIVYINLCRREWSWNYIKRFFIWIVIPYLAMINF